MNVGSPSGGYLFILKAVVVWHFVGDYDYYNTIFMNECVTTKSKLKLKKPLMVLNSEE